jgi:calcium-translocating P-type ATPase
MDSGAGASRTSQPTVRPERESVREPVELLLRDLRTSEAGLGSREAARRLAAHGANVLPPARRASWGREVLRQFTHPLALLLWLAAALALLAGTPILSWAILGVIVINAVVAYLQERQAQKAIEALARYLPLQAVAVRDGAVVTVPAAELVPGDVILIAEGDRVSADARLIQGSIEADMSALTGESVPVTRSPGLVDTADRMLDAPNVVFSGAECTAGDCRAVVFATGAATELGRIATLSRQGTPAASPLERQVRRSTWLIAGVAVGVGALFLPLGLIAGLSLPEAGVFAIGLLVANVPEGLLPTITLALAVGVRVLARKGALVKQLSAVETLGSTTVICTDKIGTLTQNSMQVSRLWTAEGDHDPAEAHPSLSRLAEVMADCNQLGRVTDPMESALRVTAESFGVVSAPRVATFPFDPERKRMSVVSRRQGGLIVEVKGAPENVIPLCESIDGEQGAEPISVAARASASAAAENFARRGLRVLALAARVAEEVPSDASSAESGLTLLGLVALLDPPRPEVAAAVAACHAAGITIHVVTGDNGDTAAEIARQVGISADRVVTGHAADALSEPELDALLEQPGEIIFSRSTPEGKLRIAEALQHGGHVVAMTGDGVNDAPALHRADSGVAMGRSGTDVAREAATMILTDDNFATIVTAVREGRRAYDNLRKFVLYIFVHAVPEVLPFAVFALSGGLVPLPLTVLQILAIDLGTEILPALALGRERAEPDLMSRRPRPRSEHLITRHLLFRAWALMGSISALLALAMFFAVLLAGGWYPGAPVGPGDALHDVYLTATTATFATIVVCQVGTAFAARTERTSLRALGVFTNRPLLGAIAFELVFVAALCYLPPLQAVFGTAPLPLWVIVLLIPCPVLVWGADELARWIARRRISHHAR